MYKLLSAVWKFSNVKGTCNFHLQMEDIFVNTIYMKVFRQFVLAFHNSAIIMF
jgi:hypothetical protein